MKYNPLQFMSSLLQICEKRPLTVKNYGIWLRYDSRSGTHNMYKEYRNVSRTAAVESLYQDMAARHRARFRSIHVPFNPSLSLLITQIIRVVEIPKTEDVKRPYIRQLLAKNLKFPLPHRVPKGIGKKIFSAQRPSTWQTADSCLGLIWHVRVGRAIRTPSNYQTCSEFFSATDQAILLKLMSRSPCVNDC